MIPRFSLRRPHGLVEALAAFRDAAGDAAYVAGGTELLLVMKMGLASYDTLIDLRGVPELQGIAPTADGGLRIGALSTHREIERSAEVAARCLALAGLARRVANVRVRNTGTIGGNLAFAEPHSDPATLLLACGAHVTLTSDDGTRRLPIDEFVLGPLTTALEPGEILTGLEVPRREPGSGLGYDKFAFFERPAASVAVRVEVEGEAITTATVALGSLTESPRVVQAAGEALVGAPVSGSGLEGALGAAGATFDAVDAVPDLNGSADYKRHLATVLLGRAVGRALEEARADA